MNQGDAKLIPIQRTESTPGPAHQRSITKVSNEEIGHQELKEHDEEGEKRHATITKSNTTKNVM